MTISPVSPTEPESSWQPPRRQVTFNDRIEFYNGGRQGAVSVEDDDTAIELGVLPKHKQSKSTERQLEAGERRSSRRTICCLSRKTFFALVIIAVFLLGGLLGGVAATQIGKKPDTPYVDVGNQFSSVQEWPLTDSSIVLPRNPQALIPVVDSRQ